MTPSEWQQRYFNNKSTIVELPWYWKPFHETGLQALSWIENHPKNKNGGENLNSRIEKICSELSSSHSALNPASRILKTLEVFHSPDFFVIGALKAKELLPHWIPVIDDQNLTRLWSQNNKITTRLARLSSWEKLKILESLEGLTKSQTTLKFQRIDGPEPFS